MPADNGVDVGEHTLPGHVYLAGAAFFRGAAEQGDAAPAGLPDVGLNSQYGSQRACTEQVMAAAVGTVLAGDWLSFRTEAFLAHAGKGIILCQYAQGGRTVAVGGGKGCGNAGYIARYREAVLF